jgi:hypothetical protein
LIHKIIFCKYRDVKSPAEISLAGDFFAIDEQTWQTFVILYSPIVFLNLKKNKM